MNVLKSLAIARSIASDRRRDAEIERRVRRSKEPVSQHDPAACGRADDQSGRSTSIIRALRHLLWIAAGAPTQG
jgi:hypothetical protein